MPLIKSRSKTAFKKNVQKEVDAGKPVKQALAIAYSTQRAAAKTSKSKKPTSRGKKKWNQQEHKQIKICHLMALVKGQHEHQTDSQATNTVAGPVATMDVVQQKVTLDQRRLQAQPQFQQCQHKAQHVTTSTVEHKFAHQVALVRGIHSARATTGAIQIVRM